MLVPPCYAACYFCLAISRSPQSILVISWSENRYRACWTGKMGIGFSMHLCWGDQPLPQTVGVCDPLLRRPQLLTVSDNGQAMRSGWAMSYAGGMNVLLAKCTLRIRPSDNNICVVECILTEEFVIGKLLQNRHTVTTLGVIYVACVTSLCYKFIKKQCTST